MCHHTTHAVLIWQMDGWLSLPRAPTLCWTFFWLISNAPLFPWEPTRKQQNKNNLTTDNLATQSECGSNIVLNWADKDKSARGLLIKFFKAKQGVVGVLRRGSLFSLCGSFVSWSGSCRSHCSVITAMEIEWFPHRPTPEPVPLNSCSECARILTHPHC